MQQISIFRWIVLFGVAIYLTTGRGAMLMFVRGQYMNWVDTVLNYGVVSLAALFALHEFARRLTTGWIMRLLPLFVLAGWVAFGIVRGPENDDMRTCVVNCVAAVFLASMVARHEIRQLRVCVLLLAATFTLMTLAYGSEVLDLIRTGWLKTRLGMDITNANGVLLPRITYTMVFTCFATVLLDRRLWLKAAAIGVGILPAIIGFASGGRGALVGLAAAMLATVLLLKGKIRIALGVLLACAVGLVAFEAIVTYFPVLSERISEGDSSNRLKIWMHVLETFTFAGRGTNLTIYAHNIFLEFLQDYGVIGLVLFTLYVGYTAYITWRVYRATADREVLWVIGVMVLQFTSQQFSLHMLYPFFWAAMVLPVGFADEMAPAPVLVRPDDQYPQAMLFQGQ